MKVALSLPIYGDSIERHGLATIVSATREAGLDGIWAGDHLALSRTDESVYPGSTTGAFFLAAHAPWYEVFTVLAYVAAYCGGLELGTSIALIALRHPLVVAKQLATLSCLAEGDVFLGVGAGWLRAEYEAVGVPFTDRGERLEQCVGAIRDYWTGEPPAHGDGEVHVPPGLTTFPVPRRPVPVLFGGVSNAAISRAARLGDGWIGMVQNWDGAVAITAEQVSRVRAAWRRERGRDDPILATVVPVPAAVARRPDFADRVRERLAGFARVGLDRVVVSLSWRDLDQAREVLGHVGGAASEMR